MTSTTAKIELTALQKEVAALAIADVMTVAKKVVSFTELPSVETILSSPDTVGSDPTEKGYLYEEGGNHLYIGIGYDNGGNLVVLAKIGDSVVGGTAVMMGTSLNDPVPAGFTMTVNGSVLIDVQLGNRIAVKASVADFVKEMRHLLKNESMKRIMQSAITACEAIA